MGTEKQSTRRSLVPLVPKKKRIEPLTSRLKDHLVFSLSTASMHGLIHIVRRNRLVFEKIFWTAVVISASVAVIYQSLKVWDRYQTSPTVTVVEKDHNNWKALRPAATMCLRNATVDITLLKELFPTADNKSLQTYLEDLSYTSYKDYGSFEKYANGSAIDYLSPDKYMDLVKNTTSRLRDAHQFLFDVVMTEFGACSVAGSAISSYFKLHNRIDNYTFTPQYRTFGDEAAYWKFANIKTGYTVYVHSPYEIITVMSRYMTTTGKKSKFGVVNVITEDIVADEELKSLTSKQRKCRFFSDIDEATHPEVYSYNLCMSSCRKRLAQKHCNCTPYYYYPKAHEQICNMSQLYCLHKHKVMKSTGCHCLPNCEAMIVHKREIHDNAAWNLPATCRVEVNTFPDIRYKRIVVFSFQDAIVQIGSLMGLFLGCSVLSLMEIFYFSIIRFYWAIVGNQPIKPDI